MTATYTTEHVAELVGVPYSTLAQWAAEGLIDVKRGRSKRDGYSWTAKHVYEAKVMADMRGLEVPLQLMRKAMKFLRTRGHNPFSTGTYLVIRRGSGKGSRRIEALIKVCDSGELIEIVGKGRGQYVLPLFEGSR